MLERFLPGSCWFAVGQSCRPLVAAVTQRALTLDVSGESRKVQWLARRQRGGVRRGDVMLPAQRESFAGVVEHALILHGTGLLSDMLKSGSALFDAGLVDPDGLCKGRRS